MHRTARAAVLAASLVLAACRPAGPPPAVAVARLDSAAAPAYADSARVRFQHGQFNPVGTYAPHQFQLTFDDGSGERYVPTEVLEIAGHLGAFLADSGYFRTATSGEMRTRVRLVGERGSERPLVDTTLVLPLKPDWVWYVSTHIRRTGPYNPRPLCALHHVVLPIPDPAGGPPRDEFRIAVAGTSISGPVVVC